MTGYIFALLSWEAVTGGLQMGGFQMGHCNIEKSALYFIWKLSIPTGCLSVNWTN